MYSLTYVFKRKTAYEISACLVGSDMCIRVSYKNLKGEKTSTNPMATIFAWSGALKKRGELDDLPELVHFGQALEEASLQTLNDGIMTKDLCGLAEGITPTAVDSEGFIKAIRTRLEAKLA